MTEFGFYSILPPLLAIFLSIRTRQVIPSLLAGLLLGWIIANQWNIFEGSLGMIEGLVDVFKSAGNTRTVLFTLLIGSLVHLIQLSGGVNGFIRSIRASIERSPRPKSKLQVMAGVTGFLIFIESNISILAVGALFRPLFDKYGIPRVKLAYLADSSSAPSCILFPVNAWGAYIIGLLAVYETIPGFQTLILSIPFNFYPILTLLMVLGLSITNKSYGPMRSFPDKEMGEDSADVNEGKAINMLLPLGIMIFSMPVFLIYTGFDTSFQGGFVDRVWAYIGNASGSSAVLYSVTLALMVTAIFYGIQRIVSFTSFIDHSLKGMNEMLSMAILMVLAFALGDLCKVLGTGEYVAGISASWLSPELAPALLFLTSCLIAFATGTSWGTFAIMISIAMPLAISLNLNIPLALGAVLGGGVFGDHCSPISDTTLISSLASEVNHIDHVRTQLPYAVVTGLISLLLYVIVGFAMA